MSESSASTSPVLLSVELEAGVFLQISWLGLFATFWKCEAAKSVEVDKAEACTLVGWITVEEGGGL